jgi:hypothetical protein
MWQSRRTNVKFKNATRNLSLRVVLAIPTFGRGHAAMGAKCRNRTTRGVNLTFVSPMRQSRRTNVKFKNATRNLSLRVVLAIPTFGRGHAVMGAKCRNRTTRRLVRRRIRWCHCRFKSALIGGLKRDISRQCAGRDGRVPFHRGLPSDRSSMAQPAGMVSFFLAMLCSSFYASLRANFSCNRPMFALYYI